MLRFERQLAHPVERVWKAITDSAESIAWADGSILLERRAGGVITVHYDRDDQDRRVSPAGTSCSTCSLRHSTVAQAIPPTLIAWPKPPRPTPTDSRGRGPPSPRSASPTAVQAGSTQDSTYPRLRADGAGYGSHAIYSSTTD